MTPEDPLLLDAADAVLDGRPIEWAAASSNASEAQRAVLEQLQSLAAIAALGLRSSVQATLAEGGRSSAPALSDQPPVTWGPLTVLSPIGSGSFGDVYLALDPKLDRPVALKLLRHRSGDSAAIGSAVIAEARLMARVRHPNVVTVHGAEQAGGRVGLWMEFVNGPTLEDELRERGPFRPADVLAVGTELCSALSAIHAAGMLHCDVKTQNVLRDRDGHVRITDFGAGQERSALRDAGAAVEGTPLYLAPEIWNGEPATVQSDVYSLGVMLFHLLTAGYPVTGASPDQIRLAHADGRRARLSDLRKHTPRRIGAVIERAIAPNPSDRYPSAAAFGGALERVAARRLHRRRRSLVLVALVVVAVASATAVSWRLASNATGMRLGPRDAVLVTAFDNRSGDPALEEVVTFALESELANSPHLLAVSRTRVEDALRLMGRPADARVDLALAREISVRDGGIKGLVSGRVDRVGPSYLLTATLIDPVGGRTVASVTEQAAGASDITRAVRRLARSVRSRFGEQDLGSPPAAERLEQVTTPSLEALRLYSEAYGAGVREDWASARGLVERALTHDPDFPAARIWLAWALANTGRPRAEVEAQAGAAYRLADRATAWERDWIHGSYHVLRQEWEEAAAPLLMLVRRRPDHPFAVIDLARVYKQLRRSASEIAPLVLAVADARPTNPGLTWNAIEALLLVGDDTRMAVFVERYLGLVAAGASKEPPHAVAWAWLYRSHEAWHRGDARSARHFTDASVLGPGFARLPFAVQEEVLQQAAPIYLSLGRPADARAVAARIEEADSRQVWLAAAALARGDTRGLDESLTPLLEPGRHQWRPRWVALLGWLLVQAGRPADATRVADTIPRDVAALRGQIAIAAGDVSRGIELIQASLAAALSGPATGYRAADTLADALIRRHRYDEAAAILRTALHERRRQSQPFFSEALYWMPLALKLIDVERRLGREQDAAALCTELNSLLAAAEPDCPLLIRLHALQAGISPPSPVPAVR